MVKKETPNKHLLEEELVPSIANIELCKLEQLNYYVN